MPPKTKTPSEADTARSCHPWHAADLTLQVDAAQSPSEGHDVRTTGEHAQPRVMTPKSQSAHRSWYNANFTWEIFFPPRAAEQFLVIVWS